MNINTNIWELPTSIQLMADIRDDLNSGISLCLIMSQQSDTSDFRKSLLYELEIRTGLSTDCINLADIKKINLETLHNILGYSGSTDPLVSMVKDTGPDVIFLQGFDELPLSRQKETIHLMEKWAHHSHATSSTKSLCMIISGAQTDRMQYLRSDLRIQYKFLMGFPSAIEMQLLCRPQHMGSTISPEDQWQEQLIPSLVGNDIEIAHMLWQGGLENFDCILDLLNEYAVQRSWQKSTFENRLKNWKPIPFGSVPLIPKNTLNIHLMSEKITIYTPEYGEEIHPSGLVLIGNLDEIVHRIWRSQSALVLPVVDELRMKVYQLLKKKLPSNMNTKEIPEIGQLKFYLDQLPSSSWEKQQFYSIVHHARQVRNKLAHLEILTLREYLDLWGSWQKIRKMTISQ